MGIKNPRLWHPSPLGNVYDHRGAIKALYPPLEAAATAAALAAAADAIQEGGGEAAILSVYEDPDAHVGLYNYAKALETVEAGLLGGFYYQHFRLAGAGIPTSGS